MIPDNFFWNTRSFLGRLRDAEDKSIASSYAFRPSTKRINNLVNVINTDVVHTSGVPSFGVQH